MMLIVVCGVGDSNSCHGDHPLTWTVEGMPSTDEPNDSQTPQCLNTDKLSLWQHKDYHHSNQ